MSQLTGIFREADDFCQALEAQRKAYLIGIETARRGPEVGWLVSQIITLLPVLHNLRFKYLKTCDHGFAALFMHSCSADMPRYEPLVTVQKQTLMPLILFLLSRLGKKTAIYYIDCAYLPLCDYHRAHRHKPSPAWRYAPNPRWTGFLALSCIWSSTT